MTDSTDDIDIAYDGNETYYSSHEKMIRKQAKLEMLRELVAGAEQTFEACGDKILTVSVFDIDLMIEQLEQEVK